MFFTNALSLDSTEDEIWSSLKSVKLADFIFEEGKQLFKPHAPSIWIYFASKDKDQGQKADGYRWRDKSKSRSKNKPHYI